MNNFDAFALLHQLIVSFLPFLFALSFHEFAHGLVAKWRGDNTAQMMGRLTLNPVAHADPIGTWLLPIMAIALRSPFFFGWARPVPVNERNLKRPRQDMFWVALAGPMSNILLALVGTLLLAGVMVYTKSGDGTSYHEVLENFLRINLFLAVFNLIPIHPLDGGKVLAPFLPASWNIWLENNQGILGMFLLFFLLMAGGILAVPVNIIFIFLNNLAVDIARMMLGA